MRLRSLAFIFALSISIGVNVGSAYAQESQTMRVDIPFSFHADNRTYPAGTYHVGSVTDSRSVWVIRSDDSKTGQFLLAGSLAANTQPGRLLLTFDRYGDANYLVGFRTLSYAVTLPMSRDEKALRSERVAVKRVRIDSVDVPTGAASK